MIFHILCLTTILFQAKWWHKRHMTQNKTKHWYTVKTAPQKIGDYLSRLLVTDLPGFKVFQDSFNCHRNVTSVKPSYRWMGNWDAELDYWNHQTIPDPPTFHSHLVLVVTMTTMLGITGVCVSIRIHTAGNVTLCWKLNFVTFLL